MDSNEHRRVQAEQGLIYLADAFGLPLDVVKQIIPVDDMRRMLSEAEGEVVDRILATSRMTAAEADEALTVEGAACAETVSKMKTAARWITWPFYALVAYLGWRHGFFCKAR